MEITTEDAFEITLQFYDRLSSEIDFSRTAIVSSYADYQESSVLLAGFMAQRTVPYFCIDFNEANAAQKLEELKRRGITEAIVVGKNVDVSNIKCDELKIIDSSGDGLEASQKNIHELLKADGALNSTEAIVVSNVCTMHSTAAACGYYSTCKDASSVIVDNTDLDSIAYAAQFIQENKVEKLTFLGGPGELSQSVVDMLSKIAAGNQRSSL